MHRLRTMYTISCFHIMTVLLIFIWHSLDYVIHKWPMNKVSHTWLINSFLSWMYACLVLVRIKDQSHTLGDSRLPWVYVCCIYSKKSVPSGSNNYHRIRGVSRDLMLSYSYLCVVILVIKRHVIVQIESFSIMSSPAFVLIFSISNCFSSNQWRRSNLNDSIMVRITSRTTS